MVQLQGIEPRLKKLGVQIIALSPDQPAKVQEILEKHKLSYRLLSDSQMVAARAFGVAYRLDDLTMAQLRQYGIDVEQASGEKHHLLPVPAVFLIGSDLVIRFQYVNPDYTVRPDPDLLIAAADVIVGRHLQD